MHRTNNMVPLRISGRLFLLIIVASNVMQGYGYSMDIVTQRTSKEENMPNDAPYTMMVDFHNVKSRKGGKRVFAGGCARMPDAPVNGKIKCSSSSGCTATCAPDYKFPNGALYLKVTCVDKEWHIEGTEWNSLPHCEPICMPECLNKGICIAPHHCDCPENFTGPQCQFEDRPCLNNPPPVLNSHKKCNSKTCTVSCLKHFTFPDGSSVTNLICKNGGWKPTRHDWVSIPDCEPVCDPPCRNGGNCLPTNLCQCPQDYRGPQCQYSADACDAEKLRFNGGYHCTGVGEMYSCTLNCPTGVEFEFPPAAAYICTYDKGTFEPQPIPQCKVDNNIKIISLGTSYNTYVRESNHSWSLQDIYGMRHSQKIHDENWQHAVHGSNVSLAQYNTHDGRITIVETNRPRPKTCFTWGGAHYKTFDDRVYSFNSDCPHTLLQEARDGVCTIVASYGPGCRTDSDLRCSRIIKLFVHNKEYTLSNDETGMPTFSSDKRSLPIPVYLPGLRIDKSAHFILVSLDSLGVKLKWDGALLLQIEASESMWNKTAGLCGTMNDDRNDEFLMKGGSYARSIPALANSWRVEDLGETCDAYPDTRHACESKDELVRDGYEFCAELLSGQKFKNCANTINLSELTEACLWDYCACKYEDRRKCACDTMDVHVRQCSHKGIALLTGWRNNDTCPILCDGGRIYMSCGPKVEASCFSGTETTSDSSECEEGCFCPTGTLEHRGECVSPEECPCRLRGKLFQPGTSVPKGCNTCTCTSGKWVCTQIRCGARCAVVGDPHYTTFDGKHYDFMGKCKYYLMKGENYTIESENVPCSGAISESMGFASVGSPSCTKAVAINFGGSSIKLKQNRQITVNGDEVMKFPLLFNGARIRIASSIFVVIHLPNALEVWWDGVSRVYINAPAEFHDQTKGLCGTFTENQKDDFATPDGDIEPVAIIFANKWKINEYCVDEPESESIHPCELNPQRRAVAEEYCSRIHSNIFSDCHWYVDPAEFHRDCMYDTCACESDIKSCLCPILAAYAKDCAALGVKLSWRAEIDECKIHCSGGQTYQMCGNSCTRSCADISFYRECKQECVEGCNCPEGQTLDANGECIPIARCPCVHAGREYKPNHREVRPGTKGQEFCSCIAGVWECRPATPNEIREYPSVKDLLSVCQASEHLEVTDCKPVERRTCGNMHIPSELIPSVCTSGCVCKSGYVLDAPDGACVKEEDCPCHHGGRSYKEGSVIQAECNTCTCVSTKWKCTDRTCAGVCSVWGDSHYKTFDGKMYNFQGICDYVLVKSSLSREECFDISIQNVPCGTNGVACSKSIKLTVGSGEQREELTLTKGKELPKGPFKRMAIRIAGLFVFVDVPDLGLVLQWDKGTRVYVRVNPEWKSRTMGLCGDYNDNAEDDFKTPSGGISEASVNLFGDSWKKNAFCPEPKEDMPDDACERHLERKLWSLRRCNVLKSPLFAPCHSEVAVEPYLQNCIFDTCSCDAGGDCECLCTALAAYAQECNARGVPVKWRTQELCPLQCDEGCSAYSPCVSTCPRETCDNLMTVRDGSHLCAESACVEGCQFESCPEGQVYRNANYTECIPKSTCAKPICAEIDGVTYYEGDRVGGDDCQSCFCSRGRVSCKGEPCTKNITTITVVTTTTTVTTAAAVTVPLTEPQKCVDGWSVWINKDPGVKGKKFLDVEPLPSWMDLANANGLAVCDTEHMIDIKCRSVEEHLTPKATGLDVECSLERGLYCQSHANLPCVDFEISVLCRCAAENATTGVEREKCDPTRPNSPHPTDCQLFYHCVPAPTGYELVEKSCGPGTLYNSETQVCDWPAEVLRMRPECSVAPGRTTQAGGKTDWISSNTGSRYENTLTTSAVNKTVSTAHVCRDGETWSECAIRCTRTCQYYRHILTTQGLCGEGADCVTGCVSIDQPTCPLHKFWRDGVTCVEANHCPCTSHDGISVAPGAVKRESDCEICQCVNNYYICDTTFCGRNSSGEESETTTRTPLTTESSRITTSPVEERTILLSSTVTPPAACDEASYVPLMRNLREGVTASDSEDSTLRPEDLLVYTERSLLGKFWEPRTTDANQWLDVTFDRPEPIYGVILQGGIIEDKFVTSYKVLFSEDGRTFSYVLDHGKEPRVFRGPVDKIHSVRQEFHPPIEARVIRVNPLTWHNGIAIKLEILGCRDHVTTLTTIKPTRPVCEDSMGLDNGLMAIEQVSVSSSPQLLRYLPLSSKEGVWRAASDNPHQYVQFDFLEARNLTGVATKGGDGAWTTAYKIFYGNDGRHWNPIVDADGVETEFLGNFDAETRQTNFFERPLHARLLRIQPVKWHVHVALKIEILGCYSTYPTLETAAVESTTTAYGRRECNVCDGIEATSNDESCRCQDPHWWDGESCVPRSECPCVVGHVPYAVGSAYETEDCQECVCALGGTAACSPKKCEPCREPGSRSVVSELCACLCKPCPAATRLCPTSGVCVNETAWCDGVQDCPDDERDCPVFATETSKATSMREVATTATPPAAPLRCERPVCPPGYRTVLEQSSSRLRDAETNVKSKGRKGFSATKGNRRHPIVRDRHRQPSRTEDVVECPEFICVPVKFPPILPEDRKPDKCPEASCPPEYEVVYEKISMYKMHKCPKYVCRPLTPREAVCNVKGRTFNTFDNMEYKYDVCNHILARDMYGNEWYVTLEKRCAVSHGQRQRCARTLVVALNERTIVLHPNLRVDIDEHTFTTGQIARIGNRIPDFGLSLTGDRIVLVSHRYGFWVIWDSSTCVTIGVVAKLMGRVDGLCGYFDGNVANDRQTPEGTQARGTVQFGNSWAMEDTPECDQHVCPRDVQERAWTICNSVKSSTLLDACSAVVDLDRFVSRCTETACSCLHASNNTYEDCRCRLLTSFVGECEAAGLPDGDLLRDWRTIHDCPAHCPPPFVHRDCFRGKCEITCDNLHEVEPCPPMRAVCFPGCFCPDGLVRRNNECVPPAQCRDCVCDGLGDGKFIGFDRRDFRFTGNCTYLLSRNIVSASGTKNRNEARTYQILITNENCVTGICTKAITLLYETHVVRIGRTEGRSRDLRVSIDDSQVERLPLNYTWIALDRTLAGDVTLLISSIQLELIAFRNNFAFTLSLPSHIFSDLTEGLCGNCNADTEGAFEKRDGKITDDVEEFGESWLIEDPLAQLGPSDQTCSSNRQPRCTPPSANRDICKKILDLPEFTQCHNIVDPKPYLDCCHDALCTGGNYCDSLKMYARKCSETGLCPAWRTKEICPYECSTGFIYQPCGSSCKETCDTLNKSDDAKCASIPVEGCFCPENHVFHNGSCIPKKNCFVCDKDGHVEGDIWHPDKCTECSCNGTIVSCQKTECPVLDTICEENMTPVLINGTEERCCAKYLCVSQPTAPTMCIEPQEPECGFGQRMKAITDADGCHKFVCQCLPASECPVFDELTNEVEQLQPGFVQMMNTSGCCPRPVKMCDPKTCPSAPDCPEYHNVITTVPKDSCCPTYECVARKDICLYTNNEDRGDQRVTAKQIGEEWKDGKCKTCVCETSHDGPKSNCLITECPSVNTHPDINDYTLEEILSDDKCCPTFERVACKWKEKIYNIGESWKPNIEDTCLTMQCNKDSSGVQMLTKVQECNTLCDDGYKYEASNDTSVNCCGTCVQVACIANGVLKNVGEQWYSDDHCVAYFCESAHGNIYIRASTETCSEIDPQVESEYEIETRKIPGKCCPEIVKTACRSDGSLYKPGEKWRSPTNSCVIETCVADPNVTKRKEVEVCTRQCAQGWLYQEAKGDKCCGECKQAFCVAEDTLYSAGTTWTSYDNCTTFMCVEQNKQLSLAISPAVCPDITDCPHESIYYDQCCNRCKLSIEEQIKKNCKAVIMDANSTLGMLVVNDPIHGKCKNFNAVEGIKQCSGTCQSSTSFDNESWNQVNDCRCCQVEKYIAITVSLMCEDGKRINKPLITPSSCSCKNCASSDSKYENRKTKTKKVNL